MLHIEYRAGKEVWVSLIYRFIFFSCAVIVFLIFFLQERPPILFVKIIFIPILFFLLSWFLFSTLNRFFYKLEIFTSDNIFIKEGWIFKKKILVDKSSEFIIVIPTTLIARYSFIRVNGNYSLEFGGLLGMENLKSVVNYLDPTRKTYLYYETTIGDCWEPHDQSSDH